MAGFAGLTFAAPTVGATAVSALTAGTVVAGFMDPVAGNRIFNPVAEGNAVATSDPYTKWLPTVKSVSATTVVDNLQSGSPTETGQIVLTLTPAAANVVEASSVMRFYLSPQAIVLTVTAGTF